MGMPQMMSISQTPQPGKVANDASGCCCIIFSSTSQKLLPMATSSIAPPSRGWDETPIDWHGAAAGPSGIYSDVQLWTDSSADAGPSREYNIDLAPKVQRRSAKWVRYGRWNDRTAGLSSQLAGLALAHRWYRMTVRTDA